MISCFKGKFKVTSPRGNRVLNGKTEFHKGIDLVGVDDTTVYSVSDGVAKTANQPNGAGNYVVITMADGRRVFYMHLAKFLIKNGEKVTMGQPIGIMGNTGYSFGSHTHLELRPKGVGGDSIDICELTGIPNKCGTYTYKPEKTAYECACLIEDKCHFEKQTMEFLWSYKYANDLMKKLWGAME